MTKQKDINKKKNKSKRSQTLSIVVYNTHPFYQIHFRGKSVYYTHQNTGERS